MEAVKKKKKSSRRRKSSSSENIQLVAATSPIQSTEKEKNKTTNTLSSNSSESQVKKTSFGSSLSTLNDENEKIAQALGLEQLDLEEEMQEDIKIESNTIQDEVIRKNTSPDEEIQEKKKEVEEVKEKEKEWVEKEEEDFSKRVRSFSGSDVQIKEDEKESEFEGSIEVVDATVAEEEEEEENGTAVNEAAIIEETVQNSPRIRNRLDQVKVDEEEEEDIVQVQSEEKVREDEKEDSKDIVHKRNDRIDSYEDVTFEEEKISSERFSSPEIISIPDVKLPTVDHAGEIVAAPSMDPMSPNAGSSPSIIGNVRIGLHDTFTLDSPMGVNLSVVTQTVSQMPPVAPELSPPPSSNCPSTFIPAPGLVMNASAPPPPPPDSPEDDNIVIPMRPLEEFHLGSPAFRSIPSSAPPLDLDMDYFSADRSAPMSVASAPSFSPKSASTLREMAREVVTKASEEDRHSMAVNTMGSTRGGMDSKPKIPIPEKQTINVENTGKESKEAGKEIKALNKHISPQVASEAVRKSLSTVASRELDANRLYPALPESVQSVVSYQQQQQYQQAGVTVAPNTTATIRQQQKTQPQMVSIKLEPHVNFEMNIIRAQASQKRHETKMQHIAANKGDLYLRLEKYLFAEYLLLASSSNLEAKKHEVDTLLQKVWILEKKRLSATKKCGDHVEVEKTLEFQTAKLDTQQLNRLKKQLEKMRQLRTVEASVHTFDRAISYFHVEQYLDGVLNEPNLAAVLARCPSNTKRKGIDGSLIVPYSINFHEMIPTELAGAVEHLKYCIDVMFFFEKQVTLEDKAFFSRVPQSFYRGEVALKGNTGSFADRRIKCYACQYLNLPLDSQQYIKFCEKCQVVLYIPPSSISTSSSEWYGGILRFRESLRKWISLSLDALLKIKSLSNTPYLLQHLMYLPRISSEERAWALRFLQLPLAIINPDGSMQKTWTEDLFDHYLSMLHLVFHPEKLRQSATLVSASQPGNNANNSNSVATRTKGNSNAAEWVLLENPEILDRFFLSDEDFVALLNQFPHNFAFDQMFQLTIDARKCFSRAMTLAMEFTSSLERFQDFEIFPLRIAQLLTMMLSQAAIKMPTTNFNSIIAYPTLFDQVFLTAFKGLLDAVGSSSAGAVSIRSSNMHVLQCLSWFPYAHLSEWAKWDALGMLFGHDQLPQSAKSNSGWMQLHEKSNTSGTCSKVREKFHENLVEDPESGIHIMHAIASIAASCVDGDQSTNASRNASGNVHLVEDRNELVIVAVHELFLAGFTVESCRDEFARFANATNSTNGISHGAGLAAVPISMICLSHPWAISQMISSVFKFHEVTDMIQWVKVFEMFPVNRWVPTPLDLMNLQEWLLLEDLMCYRSQLARFLLDHINWEYNFKDQMLFTNALLHRQVALIIAEALVLYKTRQRSDQGISRTGSGNSHGTEKRGGASSMVIVSTEKLQGMIPNSVRRALWMDERVDFEQWCWKLMLKLRFYSPNTHEPLADLICLETDRSREAFTIRRWFNSTFLSTIPFFSNVSENPGAVNTTAPNAPPPPQALVAFGAGQKEQLYGAVSNNNSGAPMVQQDLATASNGHNGNSPPKASSGVHHSFVIETEPIFAYVVCQITNFLFSDRIDRWEPLVLLLKNGNHAAGVKVLESILPRLSKIHCAVDSSEPSTEDHQLQVLMAALEPLTIEQLVVFVHVLHGNSYVTLDESMKMEELLQKSYIGGWESTAKRKIHRKIQFLRECSRFLHPITLPALLNETFPAANGSSVSLGGASALFHGAVTWISSTLKGASNGILSPSGAAAAVAGLSIRRSTVSSATSTLGTTTAAAFGFGSSEPHYTETTKQICFMIERNFEEALVMEGGVGSLNLLMQFWVRSLLQVPFWYENVNFRHVADCILLCGTRELGLNRTRVIFDLVQVVVQAYDLACSHVVRFTNESGSSDGIEDHEEPPLVLSFLPLQEATSSSFFGGKADVAQYLPYCPVLCFWSLLVETRKEQPLYVAMGHLMVKYEPKTMKKVEKMKKSKGHLSSQLLKHGLPAPKAPLYGHISLDSLSEYKIYRWAEFCLALPEQEIVQILYWQVFFALFFGCAGGTRVFGHYFLQRNGSQQAKRVQLKKNLHLKLRKMSSHCSNQAQLSLTTTGTNTALQEKKYAHLVGLAQVYTAMDAWLEEKDPNKWLEEDTLVTLPRHFEVKRLREVLALSDLICNTPASAFEWSKLTMLWSDLCGFCFETAPGAMAVAVPTPRQSNTPSSTRRVVGSIEEDGDFAFVDEVATLRKNSSFLYGIDRSARRPQGLGKDVEPLCLGDATEILTVLPHVSVETAEDRCILTPSILLNKHALKNLALKFSENLSLLVALDADLIDHAAVLYYNKTRTVTQNQSCVEGTNCKKPASFRFEFVEWMMEKNLWEAIQTIKAQSTRCDMKSMLSGGAEGLMLALSVEDNDHASGTGASRKKTAEEFLKLDSDGMILCMQILLIDLVVQLFDDEIQRIKKNEKASLIAAATSSASTPPDQDEEDSSSTAIVAPSVPAQPDYQKQLERVHEKGLEWFHSLTEMDTKLSRMVPPLRETLWQSIKRLGKTFVCVDERETCTLLQLMLEDPSRISLLSDCFEPALASSRFVEMYSKLMSSTTSSKLTLEEKLVLLRRFDFRIWLETRSPKPSKFDRETIVCIILADIAAHFPADRQLLGSPVGSGKALNKPEDLEKSAEILNVHANVLHLLCSMYLEDHIEKVLHALVGVNDEYRFSSSNAATNIATAGEGGASLTSNGAAGSGKNSLALLGTFPKPLDVAVWDAIAGVPLNKWQELAYIQVEACIQFLGHHITSLRWQSALALGSGSLSGAGSNLTNDITYPLAYWQRLGVLKKMLDLYSLLFRVVPEKYQWQMVRLFFEPSLSTIYQPATNAQSSTLSCVWSQEDPHNTGNSLCSSFVAISTDYISNKGVLPTTGGSMTTVTAPMNEDPNGKMQQKLMDIWQFYLEVLIVHAPSHVCKQMHQFLTRLPWENWQLTLEVLNQMRESVRQEKQVMMSGSTMTGSTSTGSYPFVSWLIRDILCRLTWTNTEKKLLKQSENVKSLFLMEFGKICIDLCLDYPHFQILRAACASTSGNGSNSASRNLLNYYSLPPYFVNFIKQQQEFWGRCGHFLNGKDLETLIVHFVMETLKEPLEFGTIQQDPHSKKKYTLTENVPSLILQDATSRVQLVLRFLLPLTRTSTLERKNAMLRLLYGIIDRSTSVVLSQGVGATSIHHTLAAGWDWWRVILACSGCTVLYELLDEVVQAFRLRHASSNAISSTSTNQMGEKEEAQLVFFLSETLRFSNLPFVEKHLKQVDDLIANSASMNWTKCGNVATMETDSLIRDFGNGNTSTLTSGSNGINSQNGSSTINPTNGMEDHHFSRGTSTAEAVGKPLSRILWQFVGFRGSELACLAASGRSIASVQVMSMVCERCIEKWIIEHRCGDWQQLVARLQIPELSEEEFEQMSLQSGNMMTLHVLFLQQLAKAPVLTEAFSMGILSKALFWLEKIQITSNNQLSETKTLYFAAEMTHFLTKVLGTNGILQSPTRKQLLRQLCNSLLKFGHARKNQGIMKAIGMGGSLRYNVEFHVCTLAIGVFIRLQTRNSAPLREDDRTQLKMTRTSEKHFKQLEQLLGSKDCLQLQKRMEWILEFIRNPKRSLADQEEFFVSLFSRIFPSHPWMLAKSV